MNELTVFKFNQSDVRTVTINGEPWFVLKDVCDVLGISNPSVVVSRIDDEERSKFNLGRQGEATIINESGLYNVILRSDKPEAKAFKKWVTSEVLPSIRKTGSYSVSKPLSDLEVLARAMLTADKVIKDLENKVSIMTPKAELYDVAMSSEDLLSMNDVAKIISAENIGRNQLFKILREQKVLMVDNTPYQSHINNGWFKVIESTYNKGDSVRIAKTTKVHQKGIEGIFNLLKKLGYITTLPVIM
jgi:anti-repressor protein